jgi:biotin transport system substrate-specific component
MVSNTSMSRSKNVAFCGLSIALLAVSAWITVPLGPVPFTLQTMMMTFVLLCLPSRQALISIFGYILLGAIGVPVFSGMRGGIGVLLGTSGGFIYGFGIGALAAVLLFKVWHPSENKGAMVARDFVAAIIFLLVVYLCGWLQLMVVAHLDAMAAFLAGVAPFIVLDTIKMVIGVGLARAVRQAVPSLRRDVTKQQ